MRDRQSPCGEDWVVTGTLLRLRAVSARRRRTLTNAATVRVSIPRTKVVIVNQAAGIPVLTDVSVRPSTATVSERVLLDGFAPGIKANTPYAM